MEADVIYLGRNPLYDIEKCFSTDYPVDHVPGARRTNHELDKRTVKVTPITYQDSWKLDVHGFCMLHGETCINNEDAYKRRKEIQDCYWQQIEAILHKNFPQYSRIEAFDLTVGTNVHSSWEHT
jgi:hypothetical protein